MKNKVRICILAGIGFLIGRVWLFGINPFGVALFAVMCAEKKGKKITAGAVLAGMFTGMEGIGLLKYILLFSTVLCLDRLSSKIWNENRSAWIMSILCGGLNLMFGTINSVLSVNTWEVFWLCVLESIAILALFNVYQWGVRFLLYEDFRKNLENEELISVLVLVTTALYGVPRTADYIFSIVGTITYLMVLVMGYRYGAATGAMAGAAGGVLAALNDGGLAMIGIYSILGVSVGMFRKMGRICSSVGFMLMGIIMTYAAQTEIAGIVELRSMVSAIVIFLAIPRKIMHVIEEDNKEEEDNPFAAEDVRELANYRMEDFSDAFRRLSKSFEGKVERQQEISTEEMEKIYEELSEKVCTGCVNCKYCWDRHWEETSVNIHNILWQAGREGNVTAGVVSPDFSRRCIRLESYIEKAEEKIAVAKMNLGWKNRLAENREVMARQMMEVAAALKAFTLDLDRSCELTPEEKKNIGAELKKAGIRLKHLSVKRSKDKLEVAFTGRCQANQCLTKTDVAKLLSAAAGVKMSPGRGTKNVLSEEETTMFFVEDTKYKALTGLARMAKAGENVSGDNYSFLEMQNGELLMLLADGMGSGEMAYRDSSNMIEVLEHLMEAGFEKKSALRLLNTLFVANYDGKTFTTLDMAAVDLHTGKCEMIKSGAAATFIRRGEQVETIWSEALPMGIDMEAESDVAVRELGDGDMIIMVSDGVMDGFYSGSVPAKNEDEPDSIQALIGSLTCQNPNEAANQILMHALARGSREAADDMSVLAAVIWNKN